MAKKTINTENDIFEENLTDEDIEGFFESGQDYDISEEDVEEESYGQQESEESASVSTKEDTHEKPQEAPFAEEFDSEKVINKNISKEEKNAETPVNRIEHPEFEEISGLPEFDDELRKQENFQFEYGASEPVKDEDEILQNNFKDFLVMKEIAGKGKGLGTGRYIPSEQLEDSGKKIKIYDDPDLKEKTKHSSANVVLHKNQDGEIESIEIQCKCGEKTLINLDYESEESNDEIYEDKIPDEPVRTKSRKEAIKQELKKAEDPLEEKEIPLPAPEPEQFYDPDEKETKQEESDVFQENDDNSEDSEEFIMDLSELSEEEEEQAEKKKEPESAEKSDDDDDEPLLSLDDLKDV